MLEDERDLAHLVHELLRDEGYMVVHVTTIEELLVEAARRSPCVALLDSTNPRSFDLWPLGPKLVEMGVPPVAFTAHASAVAQFDEDAHGFAGIIAKPFDADRLLEVINSICWEQHEVAAS
ncbi:MAG: hypothetical protein JOZ41_07420 [Chloroflexi bacterium]|nr:hypothetical protein [Chloroflexota bacterium]